VSCAEVVVEIAVKVKSPMASNNVLWKRMVFVFILKYTILVLKDARFLTQLKISNKI
jgi:hypothetical protein